MAGLIKTPSLLTAGVPLVVGGLAVASPIDEVIVLAITAALGVPIVVVQGPATVVGGLIMAGVGASLIVASTVDFG